MSTVSLTTLRALARERADQVGSAFVADSATGLDRWINEGISRLHRMLVEAYGADYYVSTASLSLVAGTSDYNLPADFFKLLGIDIQVGGHYYTLRPYNNAERNAYRNNPFPWFYGSVAYRLVGDKVRILPATLTATATVEYVPNFTELSGESTVKFPEMWETYVVDWAARKLLSKEESGVRDITADIEKAEAELRSIAEARDAGSPAQTVDVDVIDDFYWP